jgi:hypothetical protein
LVEVVNGSGATGQASQAATALQNAGFKVNGTANAPSYSYTSSVISYAPGLLAAAQTLAGYVGGGATLEASSSVPAGEIQLTTGSSFTGITNS